MDKLNIRIERPSDANKITAIHDAAFGNKSEGRLVSLIRESEAFVPSLSIIAEKSGDPIGHVLFSKIALIENEKDLNSLSLAPVAVIPQHQGKGIGKKLIEEGIRRAKILEFSSILVLGAPEYYEKFGFQHDLVSDIGCKYQCKQLQGLELKQGTLSALRSASATYPTAFSTLD